MEYLTTKKEREQSLNYYYEHRTEILRNGKRQRRSRRIEKLLRRQAPLVEGFSYTTTYADTVIVDINCDDEVNCNDDKKRRLAYARANPKPPGIHPIIIYPVNTYRTTSHGYINITIINEDEGTSKTVKEHRALMEALLGRKLKRNEVVHHINGNKIDNRLENLQLMSAEEHVKLHAMMRSEEIRKLREENRALREEIKKLQAKMSGDFGLEY